MKKIDYWEKFEPTIFYHVYNRGINGNNIFFEDKNHQYFLKKWKELLAPFFETYAYCLMPNHFHFLVYVKEISPEIKAIISGLNTSKSVEFLNNKTNYNDFLASQFKRLFSGYSLAINKQQGRTGSLFQKRFKRVSIKDEYRLWYLIAYIHHNPIHHKYRNNFSDWKYSSYNSILSAKPTLIERKKVLAIYSEGDFNSNKEFLNYHNQFQVSNRLDDTDF